MTPRWSAASTWSTILDACGIAPRTGVARREPVQGPPAGRDQVFGGNLQSRPADIDDPAASLFYRWTVAGDSKLILPARDGETPELYNITADPWEKENLAGAQPEKVEALIKNIDEWWSGK